MQTYAASVANFFSKKSLIESVEWFAWASEKSNLNGGLEWRMWRGPAALQIWTGWITERGMRAIQSAEQSFQGAKWPWQPFAHPNPKLALMSYALFPYRVSSVAGLVQLAKVTNRNIPVVLYPNYPNEKRVTRIGMPIMGFQPTTEVMIRWDTTSVEAMLDTAWNYHYTHVVPDLFHLREQGGVLADWKESLKLLIPHAMEIHIGLGREGKPPFDTKAELLDLVSGTLKSEIAQMIRYAIHDLGFEGRFVLEVPYWNFGSSDDSIEQHKRIVDSLRRLAR